MVGGEDDRGHGDPEGDVEDREHDERGAAAAAALGGEQARPRAARPAARGDEDDGDADDDPGRDERDGQHGAMYTSAPYADAVPKPRLIALPFHNGLPDVGMGLGVRALVDELGLAADVVPAVDASQPEVRRTIELDRRLAERVRAAVAGGAFPLVLAGNCNSSLGTVGGVGAAGVGVVWFDAHADFDTPEDNVSGFFDVMALSTLTGSAWQAQRAKVCDPVEESSVVLAAVRDLEPYQRSRIEASRLLLAPGALEGFEDALDALAVSRVYLHLDLDALDES